MRALLFVFMMLTAASLFAQSDTVIPVGNHRGAKYPLIDELDSVSYAVGLNLGTQALKDSIHLNPDALAAGLRDAIDSATAQLNAMQIQQVMMSFQQKLMEKQQAKMAIERKADSIASIEIAIEGARFLAENKKKPGVKTLRSGLQYRIIKQGSGKKPKATDDVVVHYTGKLVDGTVFDSSVERGEPLTMALHSVIPGWTEALQLMKVGSKWELYIPSQLAYGPVRQGDIPGNSTLIFEVELLDIKK